MRLQTFVDQFKLGDEFDIGLLIGYMYYVAISSAGRLVCLNPLKLQVQCAQKK